MLRRRFRDAHGSARKRRDLLSCGLSVGASSIVDKRSGSPSRLSRLAYWFRERVRGAVVGGEPCVYDASTAPALSSRSSDWALSSPSAATPDRWARCERLAEILRRFRGNTGLDPIVRDREYLSATRSRPHPRRRRRRGRNRCHPEIAACACPRATWRLPPEVVTDREVKAVVVRSFWRNCRGSSPWKLLPMSCPSSPAGRGRAAASRAAPVRRCRWNGLVDIDDVRAGSVLA